MLNPGTSRRVLVFPVPSTVLFVLALLLTFGLVMLMLTFLISFRLGDLMARPNPFTAYESIWPGQSIANMSQYAVRAPKAYFRCYTESSGAQFPGERVNIPYGDNQPPQNMTCENNADDVFRYMGIRIKDNRIQELDLFSDVLQEDTLFLYWGAPDAITEGQIGKTVYLHWNRSSYEATATITKPYSVVNLVTITAKT
jgi:hypothetical protein